MGMEPLLSRSKTLAPMGVHAIHYRQSVVVTDQQQSDDEKQARAVEAALRGDVACWRCDEYYSPMDPAGPSHVYALGNILYCLRCRREVFEKDVSR